MDRLKPDEDFLEGRWELRNGKVVADPVCARIEFLISNILQKISESDDGWSVLYLDPLSGRYWELKYPDSFSHGGGPSILRVLSSDIDLAKYKRDLATDGARA